MTACDFKQRNFKKRHNSDYFKYCKCINIPNVFNKTSILFIEVEYVRILILEYCTFQSAFI